MKYFPLNKNVVTIEATKNQNHKLQSKTRKFYGTQNHSLKSARHHAQVPLAFASPITIKTYSSFGRKHISEFIKQDQLLQSSTDLSPSSRQKIAIPSSLVSA